MTPTTRDPLSVDDSDDSIIFFVGAQGVSPRDSVER